jgi:hypothetical protein
MSIYPKTLKRRSSSSLNPRDTLLSSNTEYMSCTITITMSSPTSKMIIAQENLSVNQLFEYYLVFFYFGREKEEDGF